MSAAFRQSPRLAREISQYGKPHGYAGWDHRKDHHIGIYFANAGEDVHAVGSMAQAFPAVGCIVIRPDRTRVLAQVVPDPLAQELDASDGRSAD